MATTPVSKPSWKEVGRSVTTPTSKTERKEVKVDDYYVVVGFEVNNPSAFVGDVQDLAIDYGHAFFYLVKNKEVFKLFSFGPKGAGKVGWLGRGSSESPNAYNTGAVLKNGFQNARPGSADYGISEKVTAFKVPLSPRQGKALEAATDRARGDVSSGRQKYTAYLNDTCAETARDILSEAAIDTPSGSGTVRHSNMGIATATVVDTRFGKYRIGFTAVNPYMWHKNFKTTSFASRVFLPPVDAATGGSWKPTIGSADPIF